MAGVLSLLALRTQAFHIFLTCTVIAEALAGSAFRQQALDYDAPLSILLRAREQLANADDRSHDSQSLGHKPDRG